VAEDLVEVAFVGDEVEAAMIQALLEGNGIPSMHEQVGPSGRQLSTSLLSPGGTRRVLVHAHRAEEARALLAEATAEGEQEAPEPVNARYLEESSGGHGPRNYGLIGAYARIFTASAAVMAAVFGIWLLARSV
jgi:Putative prokaryotic signal transducing protein